MQQKILYLTIKKVWFDMIEAGIKKTEYRDFTIYWCKRLLNNYPGNGIADFKKFDAIIFINGRNSNSPKIKVECLGITTGTGKKEWGAVGSTFYFKIQLGKILQTSKK